ncbi:MAG: sulfotransferase [Myxococcota bacterium]
MGLLPDVVTRLMDRDPRRPRIFQIGFNRCGTVSLKRFFEAHGMRAAHWESGQLAAGIELARLEGRPLLHYVPGFDVYTDMEKINLGPSVGSLFARRWLRKLRRHIDPSEGPPPIYAFKYYEAFDRQYPGSRFVLNTRNVDDWVASRLRFNEGRYRSCRHGDRVHATEEELGECWAEEWREHHDAVRDYFRDRPGDLLVFDIDRHGPERFVEFFDDLDLDASVWGRSNASGRG